MSKRTILGAAILCSMVAAGARGTVFLNEIYVNPSSSSDNTQEFIELMGTPGMKLNGYGIAIVNGAQRKNHPIDQIPPFCTTEPPACATVPVPVVCSQEVDEFFSLDGLTLGANGILVICRGATSGLTPALTPDTNIVRWNTFWNGFLDTPGGMENDGSNTIMLVRNRPGATQATCPAGPCANLRWGKDIKHDQEIIFLAPPDDACYQYGDGNLDKGGPDGNGGQLLDVKGASTVGDITDDLEIVDEISYEQDQGWEYDEDDRHVDNGSPSLGLPTRRVHQIGDTQGFTPDCLTRVDYRTKGPGWAPVGGATGEQGNGNNWQDTATEQWIRGESIGSGAGGINQPFFFSNLANPDPNAVQPYETNVPQWLADGQGTDYDFLTANSYQIMAGRINPLAIPWIPGDVNRDGVCDSADISKLAAVFGNDNWIFSNGWEMSPEGDSGDPATQTRPWDVEGTGDNGMEPSDLQWCLNFQGNTNGRIVGVRYDSPTPTPAGSGVALNANAGTTVTVSTSASNPCGRALNALFIGDTVEITVRGQVTAGANNTAGNENGVMQFVNDLTISAGGVLKVVSVQPLGAFNTTRSGIQASQGIGGDLGMKSINGHSTSFTQGVTATADMYRVTLKAIGPGSVNATIGAATLAKFAASTPGGIKIGHTASNGNPASVVQASPVAITVTTTPLGDVNIDSLLNLGDVTALVNVLLGLDTDPQRVARADINCDGVANGRDVAAFIPLLVP